MKDSLNEELRKIKSIMYERELKEFDLDDITNFFREKILGIFSDDDNSDSLEAILRGDSSDESVQKIKKEMQASDAKKMQVYSKVISDDDFYSAILFGIGAPQTKHNIDFLKYWRIVEMGTEKNRIKKTAINNPLNTTYKSSSDPKMSNYNSIGVKNYSEPKYGVQATVNTLQSPLYSCVVDGLKKQRPYDEILNCPSGEKSSFAHQLDRWGGRPDYTEEFMKVIKSISNPDIARTIDKNYPETTQ